MGTHAAAAGQRPARARPLAVGLVVALAATSFAAAGASAAPAVRTCATLSTGATGPAVATVQRLVKTPADGDFGPQTAAAVSRWQHHHGLARTGQVDAATWAALPSAVATAACGQPVRGTGVTASCAALRLGSTGPAVAVLQTKLGLPADGDFGPHTRAAVRAAQRKAKVRASGVVGPATWAALALTGTPACVVAPAPGRATSKPKKPAEPADWEAQQSIRAEAASLAQNLAAHPGTTTNPFARKALAFAQAQTGKPYRYGAAGPKRYDCSGLVMAAYLATGLTLPRVAADQYAAGPAVPLDQAQPGDLVFFATDVTQPATIYHVAMYAGGSSVIDAPYTGAYVGSRTLWTKDLLPVAVRPVQSMVLPVRPGASGWTVTQLQEELDRHGAGLAVDGQDGPATVAAVKAWKSAHQLSSSATVGRRAWLTFGSAPQ